MENKEIHDTDLELKVESRLLENRDWDDGIKDPERLLSECQDEGSGENKKMALYDFSSCPAIHSAPLPQPSRGQELAMWRELATQASNSGPPGTEMSTDELPVSSLQTWQLHMN